MIINVMVEVGANAANLALKAQVLGATAIAVSVILAAAVLGSTLGWGLICSKYIESIARQPELRPQLMGQMLFTGGLMEAFPMIVLGISMWFIFANPFVAGLGL